MVDSSTVALTQKSLEDALRQLMASGSENLQEQITPALKAALPQAVGTEAPDLSRLQGSLVLPTLRGMCISLAAEAVAHQQPPMQYVLRGAAEPAIAQLMKLAIGLQECRMLETSQVLQILEDLQDVTVVEHCLDIISWLEEHTTLLSSQAYKTGQQQMIRLCNAIHKRLGKHDVIHRARLLMLIATCTPLFDRSGVNVMASFAPADPPPVEAVPGDAVDSTGKPVDVKLYEHFWKLQPSIQDPMSVFKKGDGWEMLHTDLNFVLDALAKSPATVAAVHTTGSSAAAAAAAVAAAAAAGSEAAAAAAAAASECYLSSYKLFGLQLADSAFRRGFLVQVLVLLRTLLLPGKQPVDTLKDKARMQAVALEKRVYQVLEATPQQGKDFAKAVREVLRRETTWVEWKKGKPLVPKGQAPSAAAAPSSSSRQTQAVPTGCTPWALPPLDSLSAAVAAHKAGVDKAAERRAEQVKEGLSLKRQADSLSKVYDWGGAPFEKVAYMRNRYLKDLGETSSYLTFWAEGQQEVDLRGRHPPLMEGLKVSDQEAYPIPERVCEQMLREMDPSQGIENEYKRVGTDPVYRWRIGRAVAQEAPQYDGSLITAQGLEPAMLHELMPASLRQMVPPEYAAEHKRKKDEAAAAAAGQDAGKKPHKAAGAGTAATKVTGSSAPSAATGTVLADGEETETDTAGGGAGAAAAAGGAAVKQEPADEAGGQDGEMAEGGAAEGEEDVDDVVQKQQQEEEGEAAGDGAEDGEEAADVGAGGGMDVDDADPGPEE